MPVSLPACAGDDGGSQAAGVHLAQAAALPPAARTQSANARQLNGRQSGNGGADAAARASSSGQPAAPAGSSSQDAAGRNQRAATCAVQQRAAAAVDRLLPPLGQPLSTRAAAAAPAAGPAAPAPVAAPAADLGAAPGAHAHTEDGVVAAGSSGLDAAARGEAHGAANAGRPPPAAGAWTART